LLNIGSLANGQSDPKRDATFPLPDCAHDA
jgi:hypothetical protein